MQDDFDPERILTKDQAAALAKATRVLTDAIHTLGPVITVGVDSRVFSSRLHGDIEVVDHSQPDGSPRKRHYYENLTDFCEHYNVTTGLTFGEWLSRSEWGNKSMLEAYPQIAYCDVGSEVGHQMSFTIEEALGMIVRAKRVMPDNHEEVTRMIEQAAEAQCRAIFFG